MSLYELLGTLETGLVFSLVALGAFLTFKVLDFPDLTVEGSFPLGAAVCATLIVAGLHPWAATALGGCAGFLAGALTATLNVRFRIMHILAGILVAIALYSLNIRIMGGPNKPLLGVETVVTPLLALGLPGYVASPLLLVLVVGAAVGLVATFLATGHGMAMRAAGSNPEMARANGVDIDRQKVLGVGLANLLTAVSGALFAQTFGAADAFMGIGVIIVGLASVIVGTTLLPARTMALALLACVAGAVLYRLAVALALNADFIGLTASDLQLVTAVLVTLALVVQQRARGRPRRPRAAAP